MWSLQGATKEAPTYHQRGAHHGIPLPPLLSFYFWLTFVSRPAIYLPGHIHKGWISEANATHTNHSPVHASLAGREALSITSEKAATGPMAKTLLRTGRRLQPPQQCRLLRASATTFIPLSESLTVMVCGLVELCLVGLNGSHAACPGHDMSSDCTSHSLL